MPTRRLLTAVVLAGGLATACGDGPFSADDALGVWEVKSINGDDIPGTVWIRASSGDSGQITFEDFFFEFQASPDCSYTFEAAGQAPFTSDDCAYGVAEDGDITITVGGDFTLTGPAGGSEITLTDEDTNVYALRKARLPVPVASVEVTPAADTVPAGGTIRLIATPRDAAGNALTRRGIIWASDDETVATVDNTGLVTGESGGSATITATSGGRTGTAQVTVWVGVTGTWLGTLQVEPDCLLDLSIVEAGTGAITGTSHLYAPCLAADYAVTGTNNTGGVADSVAMDFDYQGTTFWFAGRFDGDDTMAGVVYPGPHPATMTRQSLTPAAPAPAGRRPAAGSQAGTVAWPPRAPSTR